MVDFCAVDGGPGGNGNPASTSGVAAAVGQDASQLASAAQGEAAGAQERGKPPAAEAAVSTRTIDFKFWMRIWRRYWQRRKLRFWAWYERRTLAGERLLVFSGNSSHKKFSPYFIANASRFGDKLGKHVRGDLQDSLAKFLEGKGEPFLIIKGVFSRKYPQLSLARALERDPNNPSCWVVGDDAEKLLDKRRYNLIAAGLIAATGTELRFKQPGQPVWHDYITAVRTEKNQFVEGGDLTLYYRSATPEQPPDKSGGAGKAARVILFACIENPIHDPIYLIRADEVVAQLSSSERALLSEDSYYFFDNWNPEQLVVRRPTWAKHILYNVQSPAGPWLSFDPNRLWVSFEKTTAAHRQALVALMVRIREVGINSARKIVLERGDALIVDNYRALIRRYEHGYHNLHFYPPYGPLLRWLRVYYGFPK